MSENDTRVPVQWAKPLEVPMQLAHTNLPEVLDRLSLGIEEARSGKGRIFEDKDLPIDDDE